MKKLKTIVLGIMLLAAFGTAKAKTTNDDDALAQNYAITTFIDAVANGKVDALTNVLDKTMSFNMLRGKTVQTFTRSEMLGDLQNSKNLRLNCTTSTSVIERNSSVEVVKVDINYKGFTRSNLLTVAKTTDGWKIVNIFSIYV
jgi:hypothetical protein